MKSISVTKLHENVDVPTAMTSDLSGLKKRSFSSNLHLTSTMHDCVVLDFYTMANLNALRAVLDTTFSLE